MFEAESATSPSGARYLAEALRQDGSPKWREGEGYAASAWMILLVASLASRQQIVFRAARRWWRCNGCIWSAELPTARSSRRRPCAKINQILRTACGIFSPNGAARALTFRTLH